MIDADAIGVCCPGGGAKGSRQAGTLKAVFEWFDAAGRIPRRVSMASVGTLNGLLFAQAFADDGRSIETMERLWKTIRRRDVHSAVPNLFPGSRGFYKTKPLRRLIERVLDVELLQASPVAFEVHATRLMGRGNPTARPYDHDFFAIVQASASYPIIFKPVFARGGWLADRGLSNNRPTDELIDRGCSTILIAHTGPAWREPVARPRKPSWYRQIPMVIGELFEAQIALQLAHIQAVNAELEGERPPVKKRRIRLVDLYAPASPAIDVLEFNPRKAAEAFDRSYVAALATLATVALS